MAMENLHIKHLKEQSAMPFDIFVEAPWAIKNSERPQLEIEEIFLDEKKQFLNDEIKIKLQFKKLKHAILRLPFLSTDQLFEDYGKSLLLFKQAAPVHEYNLKNNNKRATKGQIQEKIEIYKRDLEESYVIPFWQEIKRREKI